jgi:hypothetical protein
MHADPGSADVAHADRISDMWAGFYVCMLVQSTIIVLPLRSDGHGISHATAHVLFRLQLVKRCPMSQKVIQVVEYFKLVQGSDFHSAFNKQFTYT